MERSWWKGLLAGAACTCCIGLAGCASPQPRDFTGGWHPLNQFGAAPARVELRAPYVFRATPLDATLKGMLTRWSDDARMRLDYRLPYDLTLHQPVEHVRSERIADALAQLDAIFVPQQIAITSAGDRIVVAPRVDAPTAQASTPARGAGDSIRKAATGREAR